MSNSFDRSSSVAGSSFSRRAANTQAARGTFWAYTYASYNQSSITQESRTLNNRYGQTTPTPLPNGTGCAGTPGLQGDQICKRAFGSVHPGGINFCHADGSLRFVSYNVDVNALQAMATIDGGETLVVP